MASLLIASFDPDAAEALSEIGQRCGYRVRTVSSLDTAREWIGMHEFDVVLVDDGFGDSQPLDFIEYAWKTNSFLIAGIFSLTGDVEDEWPARLMGVRVYSGKSAKQQIEQMLESRPRWRARDGEYGVLLVEDLDSPRDIICSYIESLGYGNVQGAGSVTDALEILRKHPNGFFAVVTDINMPRQGGIELITAIRRDEDFNHIPIIVLTAYATPENLIETVKAGATGFLVKPPKKRLLRAELEKAKRIFLTHQPPRLCKAEDAHLLETALNLTLR